MQASPRTSLKILGVFWGHPGKLILKTTDYPAKQKEVFNIGWAKRFAALFLTAPSYDYVVYSKYIQRKLVRVRSFVLPCVYRNAVSLRPSSSWVHGHEMLLSERLPKAVVGYLSGAGAC